MLLCGRPGLQMTNGDTTSLPDHSGKLEDYRSTFLSLDDFSQTITDGQA
jgi:hypothetical protein